MFDPLLESLPTCSVCFGVKTITSQNIHHDTVTITCPRCGGSGLEATEFGQKLIDFMHRRSNYQFQKEWKRG